jgi:hypothetical protein
MINKISLDNPKASRNILRYDNKVVFTICLKALQTSLAICFSVGVKSTGYRTFK